MIAAEYVHEVLRKQRQYPQGLLQQQQFQTLEQYFDELWQRREQVTAALWEEECLQAPERMFRYFFLQDPRLALESLAQWKAAFPDSFYPYWIGCFYWFVWLEEYRGAQPTHEIDERSWRCASEAQKQLFAHAMQAFARSARASVVCVYLLQSVMKLNTPSWWRAWYIKQRSFQLQHKIRSEDQALAQKSGLHAQLAVELPDTIPQLLQGRQHRVEESEPLFWLVLYMEQISCSLALSRIYCQLLLPHWQHQISEISDFCQSEYCTHFSELEKNTLHFVAWFAEIEEYYSVEQQTEIRRNLPKAQALYKRPLREQDRARVGLYLVHLYRLLDDGEDYHAQILACYQHAAQFLVFETEQINQAIGYWYLYAQDSDFLGKMAYASRQTQAVAAVLYALLCQHGWSGVEKNPLVAYSWYEYAKALEPPRAYPEGAHCLYYQVAEIFSEQREYAVILDMLVAASHLGYVYPSFLAGYIYSQEHSDFFDPDKELLYAKRAAAQQHPSALFNMGVYFLNKALDANQQQPKLYLQKNVQYFEQCRAICQHLERSGQGDYGFLIQDISSVYAQRLFYYSYYPDVAMPVIACLEQIATQRELSAMLALAQLYADQANRPHYYDYAQAVTWCEAAYLQQPEDNAVTALLNQLNGHATYMSKSYLQVIEQLGAANTPGRQEIFL